MTPVDYSKYTHLTEDDRLYLHETMEEVKSLQISGQTLLNFAQARLSRKYGLQNGEGLNELTGEIVRHKPGPQLVKEDEIPAQETQKRNES